METSILSAKFDEILVVPKGYIPSEILTPTLIFENPSAEIAVEFL